MIPQTPQIAMPAKKENDGMGLCLRERIRHSIFFCLALVTMCSLFLLTTVTVQADSVTIHDQAGVLDVGMVQAEAAKLPAPLAHLHHKDVHRGSGCVKSVYARTVAQPRRHRYRHRYSPQECLYRSRYQCVSVR